MNLDISDDFKVKIKVDGFYSQTTGTSGNFLFKNLNNLCNVIMWLKIGSNYDGICMHS